jgi:hypothetical protein
MYPNNKLNITLAWFAALVVAGCSSASRQPDWVNNPQSEYAEETHLSAIGMADDRQTAGDRAISNISKIFEVAVKETTLDLTSAQVNLTQIGDEVSRDVSNEQQVTRSVTTEARRVLEGAQVVEYWESEDLRIYALGILPKQPAANRFRQAILSQDREVSNLVNYASTQADNPVSALTALESALFIQFERDRNNQSLMIVADGRGIKGKYDAASVETLIRNALATLQVAVEANDSSLQEELEQALVSIGVQNVQDARLKLIGRMDVAPIEHKQGWYWMRGSYELVFRDEKRVLAKQRWPIKVSSTEEALVYQRARDNINYKLPQYVYDLLSTQP